MNDDSSNPVDTRASLATDPGIIDPARDACLTARETSGWGAIAFDAGRNALKTMQANASALTEAERAVAQLEARGGGVLSEELVVAAREGFDRTARGVQAHLDKIAGARESLERTIAAAVDHTPNGATPEGISIANAIRAHVASLPKPSDRTAFVHALLNAGDKASLNAILRAPSFLSGLTPDAQANLKAEVEARFAAPLVKQREGIEKVAQRVENAASTVTRRFANVLQSTPRSSHADARRKVAAVRGGAA